MRILSSKTYTKSDGKDEKLTGTEEWPIIGQGDVMQVEILEMIQKMKGLSKYWDCLEKAQVAKKVLRGRPGYIVIGALMVMSGDYKSTYGHYYNPPYEFHAWFWAGPNTFLDLGLPGVIEKGLNSSDDQGPFLVKREPVILNGTPPDWLNYQMVEIRNI